MNNTMLQTGKHLFTWGKMLLNWYSANNNKIQILAPNKTSLSAVDYIPLRGNWSGEWSDIQPPICTFSWGPRNICQHLDKQKGWSRSVQSLMLTISDSQGKVKSRCTVMLPFLSPSFWWHALERLPESEAAALGLFMGYIFLDAMGLIILQIYLQRASESDDAGHIVLLRPMDWWHSALHILFFKWITTFPFQEGWPRGFFFGVSFMPQVEWEDAMFLVVAITLISSV